jgi:hypothetical protein
VLALAGLAAFALGRRRRLSSFEVLLLVASAYLSFHAQRDLWLVVLAALAILVTDPRPVRTLPGESFALTPRWRFLVAAAVVAVFLAFGWKKDLTAEHLQDAVAARYPARAAAVVEQRGYAGPLYNPYEWGGYLMWRLPGLPVAMDGRANLHGDERIARALLKTWRGGREWDSDPELAGARLVIAPVQTALTSLLRRDGRFEAVYQDEVAVVFVARESSPAQRQSAAARGAGAGDR